MLVVQVPWESSVNWLTAQSFFTDKNPGNVEECSRIFHTIQHAYEVLSDPHERAWYAFACSQVVPSVCVCVFLCSIAFVSFSNPTGMIETEKKFCMEVCCRVYIVRTLTINVHPVRLNPVFVLLLQPNLNSRTIQLTCFHSLVPQLSLVMGMIQEWVFHHTEWQPMLVFPCCYFCVCPSASGRDFMACMRQSSKE